jgi:hypothetical protein
MHNITIVHVTDSEVIIYRYKVHGRFPEEYNSSVPIYMHEIFRMPYNCNVFVEILIILAIGINDILQLNTCITCKIHVMLPIYIYV